MNDQAKSKLSVLGRKGLLAILALSLALLVFACTDDDLSTRAADAQSQLSVNFTEDFSDNSQGWTLDSEWEIAPAIGANDDPGTDVTGLGDDGIAGTNIGGDYTTGVTYSWNYLTSPVIAAGYVDGTLELGFYRWLNTDYDPYIIHDVEVFDGAGWVVLWDTFGGSTVLESVWTLYTYDITAYANASLQVRFGIRSDNIGQVAMGGMNLDDVYVVEN